MEGSVWAGPSRCPGSGEVGDAESEVGVQKSRMQVESLGTKQVKRPYQISDVAMTQTLATTLNELRKHRRA